MYEQFPSFIHDPEQRKAILWSYIDARDAATAYRLAIETDGLGAIALNIAADDTSMDIKTSELMAKGFPEVTDFRATFAGFESLLDNSKAKKLLGWEPVYRWREQVSKQAEKI